MIPDKNHIGWTLATGAFVIASGLGLTATFAIWTATSWLEFPQFVIAVAFLFVIPGNQIIRWCRLHLSPLEHITLSAVLGMITTCWLYAGLAWLDIASLLYLWIVVAAAGLGSMWWSLFKNVQGKLLAIALTSFFSSHSLSLGFQCICSPSITETWLGPELGASPIHRAYLTYCFTLRWPPSCRMRFLRKFHSWPENR
jgi:hypothetical protein